MVQSRVFRFRVEENLKTLKLFQGFRSCARLAERSRVVYDVLECWLQLFTT